MIPGRPLDRLHFGQIHTAELKRRYERLQDDTSCQTAEEEVGRQFAMQEIAAVLDERGQSL